MKIGYTGLESSGKSLMLSIKADEVLHRNKKWAKKRELAGLPPSPRIMAFDSPMSKEFVEEIEAYGCKYIQFRNLDEILGLSQADVFINEIIKYFPASGSNPLTSEQMDFLTQGAKNGVFMYFASQDFSQAHKQFRLLVNEVYIITKIMGSPRPIESGPPVNRIWGICMVRSVNPRSFKGDSTSMEETGFPSFFFISKKDTDRFDTLFKVPLSLLPPIYVRKQRIIGYGEDGQIEYDKITWR